MTDNRLDKTYSVRIDSGTDIKFPQFCTCCMAPTNQKQRIYSYYVEKSSVVSKETRTIEIEVPICEECRAHQRKFSILKKLLLLFAILCGAFLSTYMLINHHYEGGLLPMVAWGLSLPLFFLLTLIVRTKELSKQHTARYESVTVTSPMMALGLPISFVIFTFTNFEYAKIFQNANINIAGEIKENVKKNTAKSTNVYSVTKPNVIDFVFIAIVELIVMYIIDYIL